MKFPLPNGWVWTRCHDVIDVRDGTHDTPKKVDSGIPMVTSKNLKPYGIDFDDVTYISEADYESIEKRSGVDDGDILFAMIGTIGNPVLVKKDRPFSIKNVALFKIDEMKVHAPFFKFMLDSPVITQQLDANSRGGNQKFVSLSSLRNMQIPLPPLPEQKRIAAILDKADSIRRKRQEAVRMTVKLLRSVFLDMFGDPVTNPKGWDVTKFESIGSLDRGVSKHRPRNAPQLLGGPYPLIQTGEVANSDGYIRSYKNTYSEIGLKQSKMWPASTLCITIAANIAKTGILTFDACFPDSVVGFTPNSHATTEYVQYWLSFLQKILEDTAPESAQKNINLEILRNLEIPLPPIEMQSKFSERVKRLHEMKAKQSAGSEHVENLFNSLLQCAFKGHL